MHVGAFGDVAADPIEGVAGLLLAGLALAQLLTLAVHDADIDRQLVPHDGPPAPAAGQFDALDLRRQLAALSHRDNRLAQSSTVVTTPLLYGR